MEGQIKYGKKGMRKIRTIETINLSFSVDYTRRLYVTSCAVELTREEPRDILSKRENKVYEYEIVNQWVPNSFLDTPKYERHPDIWWKWK